jgi:hypothetical protein
MTALPASRRNLLSIAAAAALLAPARAVLAEPAAETTSSSVQPTLLWAALQLVPSPEWMGDGARGYAGMRWQVTPLLYSFGINRKLFPWRSLIAEPTVRHSGSVELFFSPEYFGKPGSFAERWLFRGGVRSYFPLIDKGELLSASLGASVLHFDHHLGTAWSAGVYTLYGFVGAEVTYCPTQELRSTTLTLSLRMF